MTMRLLLLLWVAMTMPQQKVDGPPSSATEIYSERVAQAPAAKPREIIVTKIEAGPEFKYDPYPDEKYPRPISHAPTYKTGYWVLAKTTASPVINYKLACDLAPVEVGGTYFIKQSSIPDHPELRVVVFTDKDGKPSDMICHVDLEMKAGEPDVSKKGASR